MRARVIEPSRIVLAYAAFAVAVSGSSVALADTAAPTASGGQMLQEIVVTAQKREQNLQKVPVSITAFNREMIKDQRIVDVRDLNALAPNLTVRSAVGGVGLPGYTMRGIFEFGSDPGTDKGVSVYLDGVYLQSTLGSIYELADIAQIEVLKGPQGTLFGRNATAGAISITTRDPTGRLGAEQTFTAGNYGQFVSKSHIDLPEFHGFKASFSYLHDQRDGDVKNLGAGTTWNFAPATFGMQGIGTSPKTLGGNNTNAVMAAVTYEPTDKLKFSYKFDYTHEWFVPEAEGIGAADPGSWTNFGLPLGLAYAALTASQPNPAILTPVSMKRPDAVNNAFSLPGVTKQFGNNFTTNWRANDWLSLKNVLSYRGSSTAGSAFQLDGAGGLVNTLSVPALTAIYAPFFGPFAGAVASAITGPGSLLGPVGTPVLLADNSTAQWEKQWSEEIIANVDTKWVHITGGYIHFEDRITNLFPGAPELFLGGYPNFTIPPTGQTEANHFFIRSDAVYIQPEFHVTDKLDIDLGVRETHDYKTEHFRATPIPAFYHDDSWHATRPTYLAGVNYHFSPDVFGYVKYTTGYISGGSISAFPYKPEYSYSWEGGLKADLLDHHLRSNLAIFSVKYINIQDAQEGTGIGRNDLSAIVLTGGNQRAHGFEWENTWLPIDNLTLTANVGFAKAEVYDNQITCAQQPGCNPLLVGGPGALIFGPPSQQRVYLVPKWTSQLAAQYVVPDMPMGSDLVLRFDTTFRSPEWVTALHVDPAISDAMHSPAQWLLNGRIALRDIQVASGKAEVAIWGKNLANNRDGTYGAPFPGFATLMYERARTFGVDVSFKY